MSDLRAFDFLRELVQANVVAALAIIAVLLVRGGIRRIAGADAAYMLWLIVPAAFVAALIPARMGAAQIITLPADGWPAGTVRELAAATDATTYPEALNAPQPVVTDTGVDWGAAVIVALPFVWLAGVGLMLAWIASRQAMFMGDVKRGLAGPAVVGFARPRIVTPADFAERFSAEERALILAHEAVHLRRGDARVNVGVALARCVCWFNPLAHIGARAMRIDQELSCDARVIEARPALKRAYAETLVKTQLASRPLPLGASWGDAYWPPEHPLMRRVEALGRIGAVSRVRRIAGGGIVATMLLGGSLAAWGLQPERPGPVVVRQAPQAAGADQAARVQAEAWLQQPIDKLKADLQQAPTRGGQTPRKVVDNQPAPQSRDKFSAATMQQAVDAYERVTEKMYGRMPRGNDSPDRYRELLGDRRLDAGRAADMIDGFGTEVKRYLDTHREDRLTPEGELLQPGETSAYAALMARLSEYEKALAEMPLTNDGASLQDQLRLLQNGRVPTPEEAVRMEADMKAQRLAKGFDRGRAVTIRGVLKGVKIRPEGRELRIASVADGQVWIADGPLVSGGAEARANLEKRWSAYIDQYIRIEGWQSNDGACAPECRMYHGRITFTGEAAAAPGVSAAPPEAPAPSGPMADEPPRGDPASQAMRIEELRRLITAQEKLVGEKESTVADLRFTQSAMPQTPASRSALARRIVLQEQEHRSAKEKLETQREELQRLEEDVARARREAGSPAGQ